MQFVDVVLPLPLEGTFTYALPDTLQADLKPGVRVVVPVGKSKTYTAVAMRIHDEKPDFEVKNIYAVIDRQPVLLPQQLRLWQWMGDYYMATLGDIYKAALPAGLKDDDDYRPKMVTCVALAPCLHNEEALHNALNALHRAPQQQHALMSLLALTHWDSLSGDKPTEEIVEITRDELLNDSHCTTAHLNQLEKRGYINTYRKQVARIAQNTVAETKKPKPLNDIQTDAYNKILVEMMGHDVTLLHGVTSSGKTEIYIHLIEKTISQGKQVLYLLPEIALTVQMTERLQSIFGDRLGIYHSKYSDEERVEMWQKQLSEHPYDIMLGARSAVFLPFKRLGLVIIDEEHETSFKQQDPAPRYHARSVAIMLAKMYGAKTLLGTATPCLETFTNAHKGKYGLVELNQRYKGIQMPEIEIVDTKDLQRRKMMNGPFSPQLLSAIRSTLQAGRQVLLFQNRRGFAPMIECRMCGWVPRCEQCDVSLTLHKTTNLLTCHYCGRTYAVPKLCPCCEGNEIRGKGYGTEKIEDLLGDIFPEAKIARMDLDTTRTKNAYDRIIRDFSDGRTNVLIGTQMISKGLDFDKVDVVGILDADSMMNYPDFRAFEHAFMMMAQVSGRAGRKGKQGKVLLQTRQAQMPLVRQVAQNNLKTFYEELTEERRMFHYPPFYRLVYVYMKHRHDSVVEIAAQTMGDCLRNWFGERVLGPDKPSVARVKTMNIRKILIKLENGIDLKRVREYLRLAQKQVLQDKRFATLQIYFDVDPL